MFTRNLYIFLIGTVYFLPLRGMDPTSPTRLHQDSGGQGLPATPTYYAVARCRDTNHALAPEERRRMDQQTSEAVHAQPIVGKSSQWHCAQTLDHGNCSVRAVRYSDDGSCLVTMTDEGRVIEWDTALTTQNELFKKRCDLNQRMALSGDGNFVAVSSDGTFGSKDSDVSILERSSKKLVREYSIDGTRIGSLAFHPSKHHILFIVLNGNYSNDEVLVENIISGETIARLKPLHRLLGRTISCMGIHPQGAMCAVVCSWRKEGCTFISKISLYNDEWQKIDSFKQDGDVGIIAFQPQGNHLALGASGGKVGLWQIKDVKTVPTLLHTLCSLSPDPIRDIAFHPSKHIMAIASCNRYIALKDFDGNALVKLLQDCIVREIAWQPDGSSLVAVGINDSKHENDAVAVVWQELQSLACLQTERKSLADALKEHALDDQCAIDASTKPVWNKEKE